MSKFFVEMYSDDTCHPICMAGDTPETALFKLREFCNDADWEFKPEYVYFFTAEPLDLKVKVNLTVEER